MNDERLMAIYDYSKGTHLLLQGSIDDEVMHFFDRSLKACTEIKLGGLELEVHVRKA